MTGKKLLNEELMRKSIEEFRKAEKFPIIIMLDNVRSLNNIGSVFRTCDAFLAEGIYLCGITAVPPHREINKTALGATESVNWKYFKNSGDAVTDLIGKGYKLIAIEQTEKSISLNNYKMMKGVKYALVFGHEVKGVDQSIVDMCNESIEIPQLGTKHSINVAVSAGIVLWEFFKFFQVNKSFSGIEKL